MCPPPQLRNSGYATDNVCFVVECMKSVNHTGPPRKVHHPMKSRSSHSVGRRGNSSWDDAVDLSDQRRQSEFRHDDRSDEIYQLDDSDLSDDDATLEDIDVNTEEQQSAVIAITAKDKGKYSKWV